MGAMYDDLPGHEGYGLRLDANHAPTHAPHDTAAFAAACGCGWRGGHHPPTHDGYDAAVDEWDHTHARPLLVTTIPPDIQQQVGDVKTTITNLLAEHPQAGRRALEDLSAWVAHVTTRIDQPRRAIEPRPPTPGRSIRR